jgi:hypothetical protein
MMAAFRGGFIVTKALESRLRSLAGRRGYSIRKSRQRENVPNLDNFGHYMLVDKNNYIVLGERFDATLDDIAEYFREDGTMVLTVNRDEIIEETASTVRVGDTTYFKAPKVPPCTDGRPRDWVPVPKS